MIAIAPESPLTHDGAMLLAGSETDLRAAYDITECSTFNAAQLADASISFLVARRAGQPLGCVALCDCGDYAEVKRLFVSPQARGTGLARALMADLETRAAAMGLPTVLLETGEKLAAAVALYTDLGYARRGPFGGYEQGETTVFMEKSLT